MVLPNRSNNNNNVLMNVHVLYLCIILILIELILSLLAREGWITLSQACVYNICSLFIYYYHCYCFYNIYFYFLNRKMKIKAPSPVMKDSFAEKVVQYASRQDQEPALENTKVMYANTHVHVHVHVGQLIISG